MISVEPGIGIQYGAYKMDRDTVSSFIAWTIRQSDPIGHILCKHTIGSCEFNAVWLDFSKFKEFQVLQNKFMGVMENDR